MGVIKSLPGEYLPPNKLTNEDFEHILGNNPKEGGTSDEWIMNMVGANERRISFDLNPIEMMTLAAKDLEKKLKEISDFKFEDIDRFYLATNKHHEGISFPSHAAKIAGNLGIENIYADDTFAGCTGLIAAEIKAFEAIASSSANKILVGGVERLTDITDYSDRTTSILFGDGAVIYLMEKSKEGIDGILGTYLDGKPDMSGQGRETGNLTLVNKHGHKLTRDTVNAELAIVPTKQLYLVMKGNRIFKYATQVMVKAVEKSVEDAARRMKNKDFGLEDIDYIIPHNANKRIVYYSFNELIKKGFKGEMIESVLTRRNTNIQLSRKKLKQQRRTK